MTRRTAALLGAALLLGGCATKSDVRDLQRSMVAMEQRQEQTLSELARQNRLLLDSLQNSMNLQRDAAGQTSHRFAQLEGQLERMQEIVGQTIQYINQLNASLANAARSTPATGGGTSGADGQPAGDGNAEQYYNLGVQKLSEGALATARAAFQQVIREYPQDPRAADAQYQIGETYYADEEYAQALAALEVVPQQWPASPRAPGALYRAGVIAEEIRQTDQARDYYRQVRDRYPDSDEAAQADQRLRALR